MRLAREAGVEVTPIPGPSAPATLMSVAGFEEVEFAFRGFFPRKREEARKESERCARSEVARVFVWFESPKRIAQALEWLAEDLPQDARVIAGKELTKIHERFFAGSAKEVATDVGEEIRREGELGEWCFAVRFGSIDNDAPEGSSDREWFTTLHCLIDSGISASESARKISQYFGVNKNESYRAAIMIASQKK